MNLARARGSSTRAAGESLNVHAAFAHVLADLAGSAGVDRRRDRRPHDRLALGRPARRDRDRGARPGELLDDPPRLGVDPARGDTGRDRRGGGRAPDGRGRGRRRGARPPHLDDHVGLPGPVGPRARPPGRRLPRAGGASSRRFSRRVRARAHDAPGRACRRARRPANHAGTSAKTTKRAIAVSDYRAGVPAEASSMHPGRLK